MKATKTTHTPGPWQTRHNGNPYTPASIVRDYGTHSVNVVDSCDPCDAALIAAAPDLAAALQRLVVVAAPSTYSPHGDCYEIPAADLDTAYDSALAALRKAGIL